jgi:hypothetical protein
MEILGMQFLLPVVVKYRNSSDEENTVFCYIDQVTKEVMLVDTEPDAELQQAVQQYLKLQQKPRPLPVVPSEGFRRMTPDDYINEEN